MRSSYVRHTAAAESATQMGTQMRAGGLNATLLPETDRAASRQQGVPQGVEWGRGARQMAAGQPSMPRTNASAMGELESDGEEW